MKKIIIPFLLLLTFIQFTACSSSDPRPEEDAAVEATLTQGDDELPASDEVGSIPEDNPEALDELAKAPTSPSNDPFADLEDNVAPKEAPKEEVNNVATGEMRQYKVRRGDTLMKIAFKLYGDIDRWKDLKAWNKNTIGRHSQLEPKTMLTYNYEGDFEVQKLDHSYKIQNGDTLAGISKNIYGKTNKWKKLQKYNNRLIKNPNRIFAGFLLYYNITPKEQQEAEALRNQIGYSEPNNMPAQEQVPAPAAEETPQAAAPEAAAPPSAISPPSDPIPSEPVAAAPGSETKSQ